jgi:bleomycin hydrolase
MFQFKKMRNGPIILIFITLLFSCGKSPKKEARQPEKFHTDLLLKTTPVKLQGNSDLCWIYAMLATIETEHIMAGDSLELSVDYLARMYLKELAMLRYGNARQNMNSIRGMIPMTLRLLNRYGAMPHNSYRSPDNTDYQVILRKLQRTADQHRIQRRGMEALNKEVDQVLDDKIAPVPLWVFMLGCQYTPLEFAHSLAGKNEYVALTSFTHHPFGQRVALEVPDNHYQDDFLNVPLDSLTRYIVRALRGGHPVCWEGDTSEPLFLFSKGTARMPNENSKVTPADRQKAFDLYETTDDHCMEIVGLAHDQQGIRYFICKNSWGTNNPYGGFMLLSENYIRAKTICIILSAEALPEMGQIAPQK